MNLAMHLFADISDISENGFFVSFFVDRRRSNRVSF